MKTRTQQIDESMTPLRNRVNESSRKMVESFEDMIHYTNCENSIQKRMEFKSAFSEFERLEREYSIKLNGMRFGAGINMQRVSI